MVRLRIIEEYARNMPENIKNITVTGNDLDIGSYTFYRCNNLFCYRVFRTCIKCDGEIDISSDALGDCGYCSEPTPYEKTEKGKRNCHRRRNP